MRFYASCLASYNNGVLHGRWIDASSDTEAMQGEIDAMLCESRFPNVTVECVECDAGGYLQGPAPGLKAKCPRCDGAGTVPSAEEWAIHDYEGLPSSLGEYSGLAPIAAFAELVEEHSHIDAADLCSIVEEFGTVEEAGDALEDDFCGVYNSFRDYSDEYVDDCVLPDCKNETARNYFDYAAFARDLQMDMRTVELGAGVAVFHA